MRIFSRLSSAFRNLFQRRRVDRDLNDEIESFVDLRAAELARSGATAEEARRSARAEADGVERVKEEVRAGRAGAALENFARDLRYAMRTMRRTPVFTGAALLTLALGIGASTTVFSVVNAVLIRPLAYAEPDRLVTVLIQGRGPIAAPNYRDYQAQMTSFEAMGAAEWWSPNLTDTDRPEKVWALSLTPSMFPMLGVPPLYGRVFSDESEANADVVVVSYGFWQRRLAADPAAVGRTITLDGRKYTVIGVMPQGFRFAPFWATHTDVWGTLDLRTRLGRSMQTLRVFARLKRGASLQQARSEFAGVTARLEAQFPGTNRDVRITPLTEQVVGDVRPTLIVLFGAVGFVLLIACANVAHMMLARATAREREMAVRAALGAGRARLVRQLLAESTLLAACGGAAGLALAALGLRVLAAQAPTSIPRVDTVTLDGRVLLFAIAISLATSVVFGLVPALDRGRRDLSDALRDGARGAGEGARRSRLRGVLVASEFALALMLLVGAGLMVRTFRALSRIDAGFDPRGVASMVVSVAGSKEEAPERRAAFYGEIIEKLKALPGVEEASAINHLPIEGDLWGFPYTYEGQPPLQPGEETSGTYRAVFPGYFRTMQLALLRGRDFTASDRKGAPLVIIVNEELARRSWPNQNPLGRRVMIPNGRNSQDTLTVVGVAKNAVRLEWTAKPDAEFYLPVLQTGMLLESKSSWEAYLTFVARTSGSASVLASQMRGVVSSIDANVPVSDLVTMDDVVAHATSGARFNLLLLATFAGVALVLAAVGIYGVISYGVSRRAHELGIRMALGASRQELQRMVVGQGLVLAVAGAAVGVAGALALTRWMSALLYGVTATDPATFITVCAGLLAVAALASWLPARRASRSDPMVVLRSE